MVNERQYTNDDCKVVCVLDSLEATILRGWTEVIDAVSKPWSIRFYKDRDDEFADVAGVADYWVEHWDAASGVLVETIFLGWDGLRSCWLDKLLKAEVGQLEDLVAGWAAELSAGRVPAALVDLQGYKRGVPLSGDVAAFSAA